MGGEGGYSVTSDLDLGKKLEICIGGGILWIFRKKVWKFVFWGGIL